MEGKQLYNIHRETSAQMGSYEMPPWEELSTQEKQDWELAAAEQGERDMIEEAV